MSFFLFGSLLDRARVLTAIVAAVGILLSLGLTPSDGYADSEASTEQEQDPGPDDGPDEGPVFEITLNPVDVTVHPGETAEFIVEATGTPALLVQWQTLAVDAWVDIEGATSATLLIDDVQIEDSGRQFRAVFTQDDQELISDSAILTVVPLQTVPGAPAAPTVDQLAYDGATVTWQTPTSDGNAPITSYTLRVYEAGESAPKSVNALGVVLQHAIEGLEPGTEYEATVAASNSVGAGAESDRAAFTTVALTVPAEPSGLRVEAVEQKNATVAWSAPEQHGGSPVTGYEVTVTRSGAPVSSASVTVSGTTAAISGLEPGTVYAVHVAAVNAIGAGAPVTLAVETQALEAPGAVTGVVTTAVNPDSLSISWQPPATDGGSPITGYAVTVSRSGVPVSAATVTVWGTTASISGLEPETGYAVSVAAVNAVGAGASVTLEVETDVAPVAPGVVRGLEVTSVTTDSVSVSWQAPEQDGGRPITGYEVTVSRSGAPVSAATVTVSGTTASISGLEPETAYVVSVAAVNAVGAGASVTLEVETDVAPEAPGVVRGLEVTSVTTDSVSVSWQAPEQDGGRPITGYEVTVTRSGAPVSAATVTVSGTTTASISGLEPETAYAVHVAAVNTIGTGASTTLQVETQAVPTVPGTVTGLAVTSVTAQSLSISWQVPASDGGSPITGYGLVIESGGAGVPGASAVMTGATSARISGLQPGTRYTLRVQASNAIGDGPLSAQVVGTTETVVEEPEPEPEPEPERPADGSWVYTTPGMHDVNGRWWYTECEPYSQTTRCTTQIWATFAKRVGNGYQKTTDWTFNNLTYLPKMTRAEWAHNPLGFTGSWVATDRRQWRTECDTPRTGRGGCRSYVVSTMVETTSLGYRTVTKEVFNNIVLFSDG